MFIFKFSDPSSLLTEEEGDDWRFTWWKDEFPKNI